MNLWVERIYPYFFMGAAAFVWHKAGLSFPKTESLLSSTLSVSGIFVGFLATSKSIIMTMSSAIVERLRNSGYIKVFASYISEAITINLVFCICNVVGFFYESRGSWFSIAWISLGVGAFTSFYRVSQVMIQIFKNH